MSRLTLDDCKNLPFEDLLRQAHGLLDQYAAPEGGETPTEMDARLGRGLDELPDIYGFFRMAQSWFDHWTDAYAQMHGQKSQEYKGMRQRRDMMDRMASAAKLRYEGTSRILTKILGEEEGARMPRGRG